MTPKPDVRGFFDRRTGSIQYVVSDPVTRKCAVIDPHADHFSAARCLKLKTGAPTAIGKG